MALEFATTHGRRYDPVEGVAWTTYQRENCTSTYGCVTAWRGLYYDDAETLAAKYDLVNAYDVRGVGIWALGYDGSRPELYAVIKDKFITDTVPPVITATTVSAAAFSPNGDGRMDVTAVGLTATGLIRFGWRVESFIDGDRRPGDRGGRWRTARFPGSPGMAAASMASWSPTGPIGSRSGLLTPRIIALRWSTWSWSIRHSPCSAQPPPR